MARQMVALSKDLLAPAPNSGFKSPDRWRCEVCQSDLAGAASSCPACGHSAYSSSRYVPAFGAPASATSAWACSRCGAANPGYRPDCSSCGEFQVSLFPLTACSRKHSSPHALGLPTHPKTSTSHEKSNHSNVACYNNLLPPSSKGSGVCRCEAVAGAVGCRHAAPCNPRSCAPQQALFQLPSLFHRQGP